MAARILNAADLHAVREAAGVLASGGIVAFPTETVYGLGADAFNAHAVARIFEAKKRPSFDPLIVHVARPDEVRALWTSVPDIATRLAARFWPGPLTLVFKKKPSVPDIVTAGLPTVAVRMPRHAAARHLIESLGRPVAAPSANLFGYTSATTAQAVAEDLGDKIDIILDGGPSTVGVESTVLAIENEVLTLLRPGGISLEEIEEIAPVRRVAPSTAKPPSPGMLRSHYAPWTPCAVINGTFAEFLKPLAAWQQRFAAKDRAWPRLGLLSLAGQKNASLFEVVEVLSPRHDLAEAAANLFEALRRLDKMHLDLILFEEFPRTGLGLAIGDRLSKASAGHAGVDKFFEERSQ